MTDTAPTQDPLAHEVILDLLEKIVGDLNEDTRRHPSHWMDLAAVKKATAAVGVAMSLAILQKMRMSTEHLGLVVDKLVTISIETFDFPEIESLLDETGQILKDKYSARTRAETQAST